jgi:hypothetical protein
VGSWENKNLIHLQPQTTYFPLTDQNLKANSKKAQGSKLFFRMEKDED